MRYAVWQIKSVCIGLSARTGTKLGEFCLKFFSFEITVNSRVTQVTNLRPHIYLCLLHIRDHRPILTKEAQVAKRYHHTLWPSVQFAYIRRISFKPRTQSVNYISNLRMRATLAIFCMLLIKVNLQAYVGELQKLLNQINMMNK